MPFFMIECFEPLEWEDSAMLKRAPKIAGIDSWRTGKRFSVAVPEPLEYEMLETHNDQMLEMNNVDALIMTKGLLAALRDAGVDNIDAYDVVIRHPVTGFETHDYVAGNLVGIVSAADLGKSGVLRAPQHGLLDVDFEGVALREDAISGLLMFRLAENTSAVIVHERVRDHLLSKGFDMLTFVEPDEWMG